MTGSEFTLNVVSLTAAAVGAANDFERGDNVAMGAGAGVGALVGSLIFPVVGTVIGAFLGGMFGAGSTPSFESQRQSVWSKLEPQLINYFDGISEENSAGRQQIE